MLVVHPRARATAIALTLVACSDSPSEPAPPLDGNAVVQGGTLTVRGDEGSNDIAVASTAQGVRVTLDGDQALFEEAFASIRLEAGDGDDAVRLDQSVVRSLALTVVAGGGDDEVVVSVVPAGSGEAMSLTADIDTGSGSDALSFAWDSKAVPALEVSLTLNVDGTLHVPEVDDEVLVSFEGGDPNRPIIVGALWNGRAPPDPGAAGDTRSLSFAAALTADSVTAELKMAGGFGRDSIDVDADYSGVSSQQGRLTLDADVNEGDNHLGRYVVTGVTHTVTRTSVVAGGGANTIVMDDTMGGDAEHAYTVELGDGDNQTSIRFGDGIRGARPSTGQRTVTGTYRSGAGTNGVSLESSVVEPLTSDLTLDFGQGEGSVVGRYTLPDTPASDASGAQTAPSQIKVLLLSPGGSDLDLVLDVPDPDPEDGADEPGKMTVVGSGIHGGRVDFLRLLHPPLSPAGSTSDDEWTLDLSDLALAGTTAVTGNAGGEVRRLVYVQSAVELTTGSSLDVALHGHTGNDAMLAHLLGLSGDGSFGFLADGGTGSDVVATLTRDLSASGGGAWSFEVRGGDGDDVAAMQTPADLQRSGPVSHLVTAGTGTDSCYASATVAATDCATREAITTQFLQILTDVFGPTLAGEWAPEGF